jgi:hypothetical protein
MNQIKKDINNLLLEAEQYIIELKFEKAVAKTEKAYSLLVFFL